jgi:hypothetical protein
MPNAPASPAALCPSRIANARYPEAKGAHVCLLNVYCARVLKKNKKTPKLAAVGWRLAARGTCAKWRPALRAQALALPTMLFPHPEAGLVERMLRMLRIRVRVRERER